MAVLVHSHFLAVTKSVDLEVSRSHRHYASGFSKYETDIQQCHRTSLTKSDCRTNVQLLPPPFHTDITRHVRINDIWPKHHPYKTHVAKLEMFPRSDPTRTEFDVPVSSAQSRTKQELGEATVLAIDNMTRDRYRQSQYQQTFAKYNEVLRQLSQRSGSDVTAASTTVDEEDKQVVSEAIENENGNEKKEKIVGATEGAMSIDSVPTKSILTCPVHGKERHKKRVNFNDIHQVLTKDGKIQLSGVGPCWPPATSYTIDKNSQLVERSTVTSYPPAYRSSLNPELCTCKLLSAQTKPSSKDSEQELVKPVLSKNKIVPTSEIESTKSLIGQQQVVPVATKVTAEVLPPVGLSKPLAAPFMIIPDDSIVRTSLLGGIKNPLPLPPTPLSACLQPTGSRYLTESDLDSKLKLTEDFI
ncbi:uncharacterized protein LOC102801561 [Saccoglossus kowalevskii]